MRVKTIKPFSMAAPLIAALLLLTTIASADCEPESGSSDSVHKEQWSDSTEVSKAGRFYFAGQPDRAALEYAHEKGVGIVISLRSESESTFEEAEILREFGTEFHRVPVDGSAAELAPEPFSVISEIVLANPDAAILVHCSSGNRASAWYATHLALVEGVDPDQAIAAAEQTGLTSKGLEAKVRAFLEARE